MLFRSKTWPWVISILLHAAALAMIGLWAYDYYEGGKVSRRSGGGATASLEPTTRKALEAMNYQEQRVSTMPAEEKLEELKKHLDDLDAMYFRNVRGAADFVETVKGVKHDRWYRPNPAAKGKFESKTATLFDITRREKDGETVYVYTLVDADGRTTTAEISARQMKPDDLRAVKVFEMARRNPKLRYLLETALRMGENMVREGSGQQEAGSGKKTKK
jgi:hypothetical protein